MPSLIFSAGLSSSDRRRDPHLPQSPISICHPKPLPIPVFRPNSDQFCVTFPSILPVPLQVPNRSPFVRKCVVLRTDGDIRIHPGKPTRNSHYISHCTRIQSYSYPTYTVLHQGRLPPFPLPPPLLRHSVVLHVDQLQIDSDRALGKEHALPGLVSGKALFYQADALDTVKTDVNGED